MGPVVLFEDFRKTRKGFASKSRIVLPRFDLHVLMRKCYDGSRVVLSSDLVVLDAFAVASEAEVIGLHNSFLGNEFASLPAHFPSPLEATFDIFHFSEMWECLLVLPPVQVKIHQEGMNKCSYVSQDLYSFYRFKDLF